MYRYRFCGKSPYHPVHKDDFECFGCDEIQSETVELDLSDAWYGDLPQNLSQYILNEPLDDSEAQSCTFSAHK